MWNMLLPALAGGLMGKANYDAKQRAQERTAKAAADAQKVSWAKQGQQHIPQIQWNNGSELGSIVGGGLSGASFGSQFEAPMNPSYTDTMMKQAKQKSMLMGQVQPDWMGMQENMGMLGGNYNLAKR